MRGARPGPRALTDRALDAVEAVGDAALEAVDAVVDYLDSAEGRRLRRFVAAGLIASAPLVARLPWMRATPLGRVIGLAGGAALIVKAGELIRDWEPARGQAGRRPQPAVGPGRPSP